MSTRRKSVRAPRTTVPAPVRVEDALRLVTSRALVVADALGGTRAEHVAALQLAISTLSTEAADGVRAHLAGYPCTQTATAQRAAAFTAEKIGDVFGSVIAELMTGYALALCVIAEDRHITTDAAGEAVLARLHKMSGVGHG